MESYEGKTAALLRVSVAGDIDVAYSSILLEHSSQCFRRRPVGKIVYLQGRHAFHVRRRPAVTHLRGTRERRRAEPKLLEG